MQQPDVGGRDVAAKDHRCICRPARDTERGTAKKWLPTCPAALGFFGHGLLQAQLDGFFIRA